MLSQPLWPPRATGITWSKVSWAGGKRCAAVLAAVVVPGVDVGPGEGHIGEGAFHPDVTEQAKHRRELHPDRDAADLPVVDGDDLDLPLEEQGDGFLPGHDPQGLVGRVEDKGMFHGRDSAKNCAPVDTLRVKASGGPCGPGRSRPKAVRGRCRLTPPAPPATMLTNFAGPLGERLGVAVAERLQVHEVGAHAERRRRPP